MHVAVVSTALSRRRAIDGRLRSGGATRDRGCGRVRAGGNAAPTFAAAYSAAVQAPARQSVPAIAVAVFEVWLAEIVAGSTLTLQSVLDHLFYGAVPLVSGLAVRAYRLQAERLQILATRLEGERDARARLAVLEERTNMARELHDTIAHGVSVMVLHAAGAEQTLRSAPRKCRAALDVMLTIGHDTLDELERLLATLGTEAIPLPIPTPPTLAQLDALVAQTRHAGLPVTLRVDGRPCLMPSSIDAAAFRIVQESLTNALKHAGAAPTAVTVRYQPDKSVSEVINASGRDTERAAVAGSGHGIVGIRERVAMHRGTVQIGPEPTGGFGVRARLPLA